ncbi:Diphthamide biosynthesis protein 3 [Rhodotorula sp. CCFEE 5036]|nr:Diphthamide biosynthesis protein 3 [Rhodotorula sp. CCFEE 5036]
MVSYYDELEIEDFAWDDAKKVFHYPCPCGDRFEITRAQLAKGEEVATCPSCSLLVRVVYDLMDYEDYDEDEEEGEQEEANESVIPELDPSVDFDARRAAYMRQMRFGLFVRMALLALVINPSLTA